MDQGRIEQLERLQELRERGALTDAEFQTSKEKLLADASSSSAGAKRWQLWGALGAVAIAAAITAGIWAGRDVNPSTETASVPVVMTVPRDTQKPKAVLPVERSQAERLGDAFEAAVGRRETFSRTEDGQVITTKPLQIVQLPFGPALLTSREIKDGCHACTGAIGVYYLKELAGKTAVTGRWPKAVEGWGWGAPPEWSLTTRFTAHPAIFASGGYMGQGIVAESATLTEFRPSGPVTSDLIGTGYDDAGAIVGDERPACSVKGKIANIQRDKSFDVIVTGSVRSVDRYVKRNGRFVAISKVDWQLPCEQ